MANSGTLRKTGHSVTHPTGWRRWVYSTNHKDIGTMYLVFAVIAGGVAAAASMYGVGMMLKGINNLQADGTMKYEDAIGERGQVYSRIRPNESGEVQVAVDGTLRTLTARAKDKSLHIGTGEFIRDYIFIDDVISAFEIAPKYINSLNGKYFVLGSGRGFSVAKAINMVAKFAEMKTKIPVEVIHVEEPKNQSISERRNFISDSKAFSLSTGWEPQHTIEDGIDKTLTAFLEQG